MDVVLTKQPIAEGQTERARALLQDLQGVDDEDAAMDIIDREGVYTESAFIWTHEGTDYILTYIEAEDAGRVKEVSDEVRAAADHAFIEELNAVVAGPPELVDAEPLYHVVHPDRPRT
ncbi:DUF6176 family protein [Halorarius litoreus]|uniref:DUF6176 family protein n=1 Tax=Halorarius litoreus TaxID=2962676 RepID=UPI0020CECF00|nr:DUF6176 family protein [Halorarius litoreus]